MLRFWRGFEGASAARELADFDVLYGSSAVFLEPRRPPALASVFTSTLARDGRTDETLSFGSSSNPPRDVKYIVVSDHIMLCHFC